MRLERGLSAFDQAHRELDNLFSRFFGGGWLSSDSDGGASGTRHFGVDICEDADKIYVEADLPGFRKEEIDISLHNGMLTITAERREGDGTEPKQGQGQQKRSGEQEPTYLLRERRQQRLVRSFSLPPSADESKIEAKLDNGVLRLTVEKRPETRAKRISVT